MRRLLVLFLWVLLLSPFYGDASTVISLRGHLDKDTLKEPFQAVQKLRSSDETAALLEVSSNSGDLLQVLELVKDLYQLKSERDIDLIVYIDEEALGPAAAIPFVADELVTSTFVSWGDIPLGSEDVLPTNILRSRVRSFVNVDKANGPLLSLIAEGMTDPTLIIVDDNGWRAVKARESSLVRVVSPAGERLIVDHNQLQRQGLTSAQLSLSAFRERFGLEQPTVETEVVAGAPGEARDAKALLDRLKEHIEYNASGPNTVGRIVIDDAKNGITQATWIYVKAALDHYKETKPAFIILELNTPGGEVFSSQQISDALKEMDTRHNIPVVAFINNWAISAGAMLAYSCRFIAIAKDAAMGAAEPVLASQEGGMKSASEKINSALRADFANRAGFYERDPLIAQAMVDKDIIIVRRYGRVVQLDNEEQIRRGGQNPDEVLSRKGKLLTLDAKKLIDYGVADFMLPPVELPPLTEAELEAGRWSAEKSLVFTHPYFNEIPQAEVDTFAMTWQLSFLAFLSLPAVSSVLFLGLMLGAYLELNSPGFGLPGSIAIGCLFLIVLSSVAMEAASSLELIMVAAGIVLLAVEAFVIPGFGVAGILGICLLVGGLFALMLPGLGTIAYEVDSQTLNAAGQEFFLRLTWLAGTLIVGIILMLLLAQYAMPNFPLFNRLALVGGEETKEEGYHAGAAAHEVPQVGARGEVLAPLRPAGRVLFAGEDFDAVSSGRFLDKGTSVVVVRVEGSKVVVEEAPKEDWDKA